LCQAAVYEKLNAVDMARSIARQEDRHFADLGLPADLFKTAR
jgi:hypothetical protein